MGIYGLCKSFDVGYDRQLHCVYVVPYSSLCIWVCNRHDRLGQLKDNCSSLNMVNSTWAKCECGNKIHPRDRDKTEHRIGNILFHFCSDKCKQKTCLVYENPEIADDMELVFITKAPKIPYAKV
jgi:hypothetical protein